MKTIVVANDDTFLLQLLSAMLGKDGYKTYTYTSGSELLNKMPQNLDLILLDIEMGDTNGLDVCRVLKQNVATANIPVIMISAHEDLNKLASDAGANYALHKPFTKNTLIKALNTFIV